LQNRFWNPKPELDCSKNQTWNQVATSIHVWIWKRDFWRTNKNLELGGKLEVNRKLSATSNPGYPKLG
jgi:hypothetical protein